MAATADRRVPPTSRTTWPRSSRSTRRSCASRRSPAACSSKSARCPTTRGTSPPIALEGYADQLAMQEGLWLDVSPPNGLQDAHQSSPRLSRPGRDARPAGDAAPKSHLDVVRERKTSIGSATTPANGARPFAATRGGGGRAWRAGPLEVAERGRARRRSTMTKGPPWRPLRHSRPAPGRRSLAVRRS